jgi:hypothetical protein
MWSIDSMSRAPRWPSPVLLLKRRMNFLTIQGQMYRYLEYAYLVRIQADPVSGPYGVLRAVQFPVFNSWLSS